MNDCSHEGNVILCFYTIHLYIQLQIILEYDQFYLTIIVKDNRYNRNMSLEDYYVEIKFLTNLLFLKSRLESDLSEQRPVHSVCLKKFKVFDLLLNRRIL